MWHKAYSKYLFKFNFDMAKKCLFGMEVKQLAYQTQPF